MSIDHVIHQLLDMLADAVIYGVSLYAVDKPARLKLKTAHFSGWLPLVLALGVIFEVVRRFLYGGEPVSELMMSMGVVANAGVITAGILVAVTGAQIPDLMIGGIIGLIVLSGARRNLLLS